MKKLSVFLLLMALLLMFTGCKAEPLEGIMSQPADDAPNRAFYFCAPKEADSLYIDTYHLIDGQWQLSHRYGIADDESEMNEGVLHGTLKLRLQEDLSINYEFSYAGLHYYFTEAYDADLKNTDAIFHKETQYDIVLDTPMPIMLITDGGAGDVRPSDFAGPEKLADCKMAQALVLTFSTDELEE